MSSLVHEATVSNLSDAESVVSLLFNTSPVSIESLRGGLTNSLYKAELSDGSAVLIRQEGIGLVDRDHEKMVMMNIGEPKVYSYFKNGMVYEYIKGRSLRCEEIRREALQPLLGAKTAQWHTTEMTELPREPAVVSKTTEWLNKCAHPGRAVGQYALADLYAEIQWVEGFLRSVQSPVVFCHNDLIADNIILRNDGSLAFIDFEYARYNNRGFDIGNHFCEYAGYGLDYNTFYPSREQQRPFLVSYIEASKRDSSPATEAEIEQLGREADAYTLLSHLSWSIWGVCRHDSDMEQNIECEFDFLNYAHVRLQYYFEWKDRLRRTGMIKP